MRKHITSGLTWMLLTTIPIYATNDMGKGGSYDGSDMAESATIAMGDISLPVSLSSFSGKIVKEGVKLRWSTSSEIENMGFTITRKSENIEKIISSFEHNAALHGQGSTTRQTDYSFFDRNVIPGHSYTYILSDVDYAGNKTSHTDKKFSIFIPENAFNLPESYVLTSVYPNPFNAAFVIPFMLNETVLVNIILYDIAGREMKIIMDQNLEPGSYKLQVDTRSLASSVYFLRMKMGVDVQVQELVLLK